MLYFVVVEDTILRRGVHLESIAFCFLIGLKSQSFGLVVEVCNSNNNDLVRHDGELLAKSLTCIWHLI
jgi:hypothetical protein